MLMTPNPFSTIWSSTMSPPQSRRKKKKFLLFFVNDNEVIKKYLIVKTVQGLTECRHIFSRVTFQWNGVLLECLRGHLLLTAKIVFRAKFMLHDFYVGTFFDYIFLLAWLFFALWSPMWNFIIFFSLKTWCSPSG